MAEPRLGTSGATSGAVLIVDDHRIIRENLVGLLTRAGIEPLVEFADGGPAVDYAQRHQVRVAIVDLKLPGSMTGLELVRRLRAQPVAPQVLVLSADSSPVAVEQAYRAGAIGYLAKTHAGGDLIVSAVHSVGRGERFEVVGPPEESGPESESAILDDAGVSPREREVLAFIGTAADNLQIAAFLGITERTVKAHVAALYRKLLKTNRTELAMVARDLGLRPPGK